MCMIALRPVGDGKCTNIPNAVIDTAMNRHPDGFGLMWQADGKLHTASYAPRDRKAFRRALKRVDAAGHIYASHFRWATSGPKDQSMAHPYTYSDPDPEVGTVAVMHNGVIDIAHDKARESDTSAFVRLVLAQLPTRWWTQPALTYLVGEAIGWSKLVIMTATEVVNLHEKRGDWDNGIWYSSDHRPQKQVGRAPTTVGQNYGHWDNDAQKWVPGPASFDYNSGKGQESTGKAQDGVRVVTSATTDATALVPYKGSARKAGAALGLLDEPDDIIRVVDRPQGFRHGGHSLTAIAEIGDLHTDADYIDGVICDTCHTVGTVYVIDGGYYIDMGHIVGADEDEDTFLPADVTARTKV